MMQNYYCLFSHLHTSLEDIRIPLTTLTYHSVLLHYDMSTASSDSTLYRCEVCNKTFNSQDEIERHNKETHIETAGQKE